MAATFRPRTRSIALTPQSSSTGANLSFTLPALVYPGDLILMHVCCATAATVGQSAGVTLTDSGQGQGFTNAKQILSYAYARSPASAGAGVSQDAGTTITITNNNSTLWTAQCIIVARAHLTFATADGTPVKGTSGASVATYTASGCTPASDYTTLLTFFAFGSDSNNVAQSWPATVALGAGGTDDVVSGQSVCLQAAGQRTRGVAIYGMTAAPTNGVAADTRAVTMVTGASVGRIGAIMIAIQPMTGDLNDVVYGDSYIEGTPADAAAQVFDVHYPTSGSAGPWPACIMFHGGIIGGDRYIDLTKHLLPQAIQAAGYAAVTIEYRQPSAGVQGGEVSLYDWHTALRYLLVHAATYNLDPANFVVSGSSAGGTNALLLWSTLNNSTYYGPSPENSATTETFNRMLVWFPGSNHSFQDAWKTELGIANPTPSCTFGSDIGYALGAAGSWTDPCNDPRWNATTYPGGTATQDTGTTVRINQGDPAYWAQYTTSGALPPIYLMHGTNDNTVAYKVSNHDGSDGFPPGLYQRMLTYNRDIHYTELAGAGHGGAGWYPSAQAGATNGDAIDLAVAWLTGTYDFPVTSTTRAARRSRVAAAVTYFKLNGMWDMVPPGFD